MDPRSRILLVAFAALSLCGVFGGLPWEIPKEAISAPSAPSVSDYPPPDNSHPSYSPDGREVAFQTDWYKAYPALWAISTVDGRLQPIAKETPTPYPGRHPAWSPTGLWIAAASNTGLGSIIWLVRPDGSGATPLTAGRSPAVQPESYVEHDQPAWSPDGKQIAFVSGPPNAREIWIVNADGTGLSRVIRLHQIVDRPRIVDHPSFSPDGRQIVFSASTENFIGVEHFLGFAFNLFVVNVDGTGLKQLTTGPFLDTGPSWSERGILFASNRPGSFGIRLIQPDGTALQVIPNAVGVEPIWSPDRSKIAFSRAGNYISNYVPGPGPGIYEYDFSSGLVRPLVQIRGRFIAIDIMPGTSSKAISLRGTSLVRVAILYIADLGFEPVQQFDRTSITFGRTGEEHSLTSCAEDGKSLVCDFKTALTGFLPGDTLGILRLVGGGKTPPLRFRCEGRGAVQIVP